MSGQFTLKQVKQAGRFALAYNDSMYVPGHGTFVMETAIVAEIGNGYDDIGSPVESEFKEGTAVKVGDGNFGSDIYSRCMGLIKSDEIFMDDERIWQHLPGCDCELCT